MQAGKRLNMPELLLALLMTGFTEKKLRNCWMQSL